MGGRGCRGHLDLAMPCQGMQGLGSGYGAHRDPIRGWAGAAWPLQSIRRGGQRHFAWAPVIQMKGF